MDSSSISSELFESLDFLRPPVNRTYRYKNRGTSPNLLNQNKTSRAFKDLHHRITAGTQQPQFRGAGTSTSLILNKTKEKVFEKYSVLSYTNLLYTKKDPKLIRSNSPLTKDKPLIKVTVTPKSTQTASVLRKRKNPSKRLQNTVSNQENSVHANNVYLVVPSDRRKEKVYQIKTTNSAKFANARHRHKDEVIPITQLSSLKLVLDSLNMERRKEKNKKKRKKYMNDASFEGDVDGNEEYPEGACHLEGRQERMSDVAGRPSYVRIMGSLGLADNDRYVLRCAATVNDNPVATEFTQMSNHPSTYHHEERRFLNVCDENTCAKRCFNTTASYNYCRRKDGNTQTDVQDINLNEVLAKTNHENFSKETQATQVNFDIGLSSQLARYNNVVPYKDEIVQCHCAKIANRESSSESDSDANSVKSCHSPLVIISVYPAPCPDNLTLVQNHSNDHKKTPARQNDCSNQNVRQRTENYNVRERRNVVRSTSRSPSPNRNQNRSLNKTNTLADTKNTRSRRNSPDRDTYTVVNNRQTRTAKDRNITKPFSTRDRIRERSPQKNTTLDKETKGTNTDHNITKKMLVDNYTKKLTAYMDNNRSEKKSRSPKKEPSKVTVDIEGDNEHYDFILQQDNATTDLKVKRTVKKSQNKNPRILADIFPHKNKFLMMPDEPRKKIGLCRGEQKNDAPPLKPTFSRLQVRDSLEVSHRHDVKTEKFAATKTAKHNDDSSEPFSAPIKHYTGDNCPIPDPIQRDKEIRSLLGIDKGVNSSIAKDVKVDTKKYAVPLHYFYNKTCEKKIVTGINVMEVPSPSCVCCDIQKHYCGGSGSVHSRRMDPHSPPYMTHANPYREADGIPDTSESPSPDDDNITRIRSSHSKSHDPSMPNNNTGTQYETQVRRTSLYQQLILNRNIQVFLQVEQFSKQRPIVLSRKQYDKVKRTIENTIGNKISRKKCICKTSLISVGDVRRKPRRNKTDGKDLGVIAKRSSSVTDKSGRIKERPCACDKVKKPSNTKVKTLVLFSKEMNGGTGVVDRAAASIARQTVSSLELRYASMSYIRHVTFSSTNVEVDSNSASLQPKESHSIHTIFKGRRKCHTPNLGTSLYSLCSEEINQPIPDTTLKEPKKRPFLRRLMSCLVMRSARVSNTNIAPNPTHKSPSVESSIDSYHISTSLGEIEVTSSMYDTSASFYTNHSVYPVNSKMKRGFFISVRDFLTNRKS